jgi:hypothetical protein
VEIARSNINHPTKKGRIMKNENKVNLTHKWLYNALMSFTFVFFAAMLGVFIYCYVVSPDKSQMASYGFQHNMVTGSYFLDKPLSASYPKSIFRV